MAALALQTIDEQRVADGAGEKAFWQRLLNRARPLNPNVRLLKTNYGIAMTAIDDALLHSQRWGRQTILFAFCVRDHSDGKSRDDPTQIKHAMTAADDVAEQLWKQATSNDIPNHQIPLVFAKLVLDWVSNHLKP